MHLYPQEVVVMLNILQGHPRPNVPLIVHNYERYFSRTAVPPKKVIKNIRNEPQVIVVDKQQAIDYLKDHYGFTETKDVINGSHRNL